MENKRNTIHKIGRSPFVNMGAIRLRQPLPANDIEEVDPFILLHHYGPFEISPEKNPMDLGPHPHRGFEPVTFLIQGEQLHRDSLGNESVVKAGDVQWTTAGRGIIHAEGPHREFVERGGTLEGIQLWINLPASKKMIQPNYQHVKDAEFNEVISEDGLINSKVIAGSFGETNGKIQTQTPLDVFMIDAQKGGQSFIPVKENHQAMIYLIHGQVTINNSIVLRKDSDQMITFQQDGAGFTIEASDDAKLLFLSGEPIREKVVNWGPYVMNTQTEILEAMRDFQMGKMGFLPAS
jgi:redox-sensitive bicupin YhaK (pirin superfamily)